MPKAVDAASPIENSGLMAGKWGADAGKFGTEAGKLGVETGKLGAEAGKLVAEAGEFGSGGWTAVTRVLMRFEKRGPPLRTLVLMIGACLRSSFPSLRFFSGHLPLSFHGTGGGESTRATFPPFWVIVPSAGFGEEGDSA